MLPEAQRLQMFPVLAQWAYLNTAFRGPISAPAADAAKDYIDGLRVSGVTAWRDWQQTWESAHAEFAGFIGAGRDEVEFLANATDALTRVTLGLDFKPGDHAIVFERDYPGVVRPVLALRNRGVEVTLLPEVDGKRSAAQMLAACTPRTRLIAASWVDFRTGFRLDVHELASQCRGRGILCVIDAVQAIGAMPIDVKALGADVCTFATRKYLNGLDSLGVLYVSRDALSRLAPHSAGTYSVQEPFNFEAVEQPFADGARRFMLGAPSMPQVYALRAALALQRQIGVDRIHAAVSALADEVRARARDAGYTPLDAAWPPENRSQIVSIPLPTATAQGLDARLEQARVAAALRHGVLRVAPHWYNSAQEIKRLFAVLGPARKQSHA